MPTASRPRRPKSTGQKYLVPVVLSTFRLLEELSKSGPLSLAELVARAGVAKSTVFRILTTLHHLGYVRRDPQSRTYAVSPRVGELSCDVDWGMVLHSLALPLMTRLRDEFGETVNLGRLDFDRVVYLEVVESQHALRLCERKGGWEYAHASALGKAILAFSPPAAVAGLLESIPLPKLTGRTITDAAALKKEVARVRRRGYALDREEARAMACCIAAPILAADGAAIAAISISGPSSRFNPATNRSVPARLLESAAELSARLSEAQTGTSG